MFPPKGHYLIFRSHCANITQHRKLKTKIESCLKQKLFTQYTASRIKNLEIGNDDTKYLFKDSMNVQIILSYASNKRNVYEEVFMFDETSLVGSLGGSLGLFVGFSFFGYAMPIIEALFDKIADCFERLKNQ